MNSKLLLSGLVSSLLISGFSDSFTPIETEAEVKQILNFLVSSTDSVGVTYQGSVGDLNNLSLPLSYYSTADYWGKYVGELPGNDLTVTDVYNSGDYTLTPDKSTPGAQLQVERVNGYYGTDIYDAACWQIALALAAKNSETGPSGQNLFDLAQNQDTLLYVGYDGNAPQPQAGANRATTRPDGTFSYNGENITEASKAYFFRMVSRNWLSHDPFMGTSYMKYITADNLPPNPQYQAGMITWLDWKPITGENAWGLFIGPLHTAYLKQQSTGADYVPFASHAVQNAMGTFYALSAMQSEIGGIYYACKGSLGNQGEQPIDPYEVSVENNASALGGLLIFKQVLQDELSHETDLTAEQKSQVQSTLSYIDVMINGGTTLQGKQTKGLLAFFKDNAWDATDGIFYQGGDANDPQKGSDWVPTLEPKAVDVSTWGVAVLGQPLIDSWHGFGTCYKIWQDVKSWGGFYGPDKTLWGVGYSDEDGNGTGGDYEKGIISAEWTAGAVNMMRCLITQYKAASTDSKYTKQEQQQALGYVTDLQKDHDSMFTHLMTLRSDNYPTQAAYDSVRPADYTSIMPIPSGKLAFIYASKRYMIPFGWFANPIPSTTSTSWALMLHYNFNPFSPNGSYDASFAAPSVKLTTEDLQLKAQDIKETFDDGLQWEDFGAIVGHALDFIMDHKDLSKEEVKANIITMLDHIIDITDTPYLPDSFTDPIFKAMLPPFVDFVVDGVHGSFKKVLKAKPGKPTPKSLKKFLNKMKRTYADGFQWTDIMTSIKFAIEFAGSYPSLSKEEQKKTVIDLVNHIIDETDTPYLPDFFVDPVFKAIAPIFVDEIFKRLP